MGGVEYRGEIYPFPSLRRRKIRNRLLLVLAAAALLAGAGTWLWRTVLDRPDAPVITAVSPAVGETTGGTLVTIDGAFFGPETRLWFGDQPAQRVDVSNPTRLTAISPRVAWPGLVDVSVGRERTDRSTLKEAYRYVSYLSITSATPTSGPPSGGTVVTILGSGFAPDTRVFFGDIRATRVTYVDQRTLRVMSPRAAAVGALPIRVVVADSEAPQTTPFTYR